VLAEPPGTGAWYPIGVSEKVSPPLREQLEAAGTEEARIPIIVTVAEGADGAALAGRTGMEVRHAYENIPAVAATATPAQVRELAQQEQVELIEPDGEMRAL
jgi:hypothetical protein